MRADAKKNLKKVATEAIKDPTATVREIAERAGVSTGTSQSKLTELEQSGKIKRTEMVVEIADKDLKIVSLGQNIIIEKLEDDDVVAKTGMGEISQTIERSQKRYSHLGGDNANDDGTDKESKNQTVEELLALKAELQK